MAGMTEKNLKKKKKKIKLYYKKYCYWSNYIGNVLSRSGLAWNSMIGFVLLMELISCEIVNKWSAITDLSALVWCAY